MSYFHSPVKILLNLQQTATELLTAVSRRRVSAENGGSKSNTVTLIITLTRRKLTNGGFNMLFMYAC